MAATTISFITALEKYQNDTLSRLLFPSERDELPPPGDILFLEAIHQAVLMGHHLAQLIGVDWVLSAVPNGFLEGDTKKCTGKEFAPFK